MRVLITGATTPIGAALIERLLADPAVEHVLAVSRQPPPPPSARLTSIGLDLTRPRLVHDLVHGVARELAVDVVVHGALHRSAHDGGARVHAANVETTRQLLLACEAHPTRGKGFRLDFESWIDLDLETTDGYPRQTQGVSPHVGLYFMGLQLMHTRKSGLIFGVGEDADPRGGDDPQLLGWLADRTLAGGRRFRGH